MDRIYQDFISEFPAFFINAAEKAVFLLGVLTQNLLDIQFKKSEGSSTPFRKRLNSLKLNGNLVKKIYPEVIEKLEQYNMNYYRELENTISEHFLRSDLTKLSNDEVSFYFVLGMTMNKKFKSETKKEEVK